MNPNNAAKLRTDVELARDFITAQRVFQPDVAIVLGSGLGGLADRVEHETAIPYDSIPGFPKTHAVGHAGKLILGFVAGLRVVMMQGRAHRYEGRSIPASAFPIECMLSLGANLLITTNAAGGLNPRYEPGDLMVIDSHIDRLQRRTSLRSGDDFSGQPESSTQVGIQRGEFPYDYSLIRRARQLARQEDVVLHQGCYLGTLGPTYETRSEYKMFRWMGADAVGMSTIPEVLAAQKQSVSVLAFSVITNVASTDVPQTTTHDEVVDVGNQAGPKLLKVIEGIMQDMSGQPD